MISLPNWQNHHQTIRQSRYECAHIYFTPETPKKVLDYVPQVAGGLIEGGTKMVAKGPWRAVEGVTKALQILLTKATKALAVEGVGGIAEQQMIGLRDFSIEFFGGFKEIVVGVREAIYDEGLKQIVSTVNPFKWTKNMAGIFWKAPKRFLYGIGRWINRTGVKAPSKLIKHNVFGTVGQGLKAVSGTAEAILESGEVIAKEAVGGLLEEEREGVRIALHSLIPGMDYRDTRSSTRAAASAAAASAPSTMEKIKEAASSVVNLADHKKKKEEQGGHQENAQAA